MKRILAGVSIGMCLYSSQIVFAQDNEATRMQCRVEKGTIVCPDKEFEKKILGQCKIEKGKIVCPEDKKEKADSDEVTQYGEIVDKDFIYSQSNFQESRKSATTSIDVITREDMELQNKNTLYDTINTLSSVDINAQGSAGNVGTLRIRGKQKVSVTLDGVRISDPLDNSIDLRHFLSDGLDRIEVIKGPQGTIGGNAAQGGMLSMYTRRGAGAPTLEFTSGMGSFGTFKETGGFSGGNDLVDYYLGITRLDTQGGMITTPEGKSKRDDYGNLSLSSNIGARLLKGKAELRNTFRYIEGNKQVGIQSGDPLTFDPDDRADSVHVISSTEFNHKPTSWYDYVLRFGVGKDRYKSTAGPLAETWGPSYYRYDNNRLQFSTQHNLRYKDLNTFSVGYGLEYNDYKNTSNVEKDGIQHDVYFNDVINIKDIVIIRPGIRIMHDSDWGTFATPNISGALILPTPFIPDSYSKIRSSYGYSVTAPTLVQLHAPGWGSSDLKPEKLTGWDIGFEQSFLKDKVKFDIGYFNNEYSNLIDFDWTTWKYANISAASTKGVETSVEVNPLPGLKLGANYTYTASNDGTKNDLPAVPRNKYNFLISYSPVERFSVYAKATTASSRRYNHSSPPNRVDGFLDASIGATVRLFKIAGTHVYAYGQLNNITNDKYDVYKGYKNPGIGFMAGITLKAPLPELPKRKHAPEI